MLFIIPADFLKYVDLVFMKNITLWKNDFQFNPKLNATMCKLDILLLTNALTTMVIWSFANVGPLHISIECVIWVQYGIDVSFLNSIYVFNLHGVLI